jgi:hypothetical protein
MGERAGCRVRIDRLVFLLLFFLRRRVGLGFSAGFRAPCFEGAAGAEGDGGGAGGDGALAQLE